MIMSIDLKDISVPKQEKKQNKKESNPLDFLNKEISFSGNKLKDKQKEDFYSSLSMLLSSGIDMRSALKIIFEEQKKKKEKEIFNQLYENLVGVVIVCREQ